MVIQVELVARVVLDHPWKDRVLREVIERSSGQNVDFHQVVKIWDQTVLPLFDQLFEKSLCVIPLFLNELDIGHFEAAHFIKEFQPFLCIDEVDEVNFWIGCENFNSRVNHQVSPQHYLLDLVKSDPDIFIFWIENDRANCEVEITTVQLPWSNNLWLANHQVFFIVRIRLLLSWVRWIIFILLLAFVFIFEVNQRKVSWKSLHFHLSNLFFNNCLRVFIRAQIACKTCFFMIIIFQVGNKQWTC